MKSKLIKFGGYSFTIFALFFLSFHAVLAGPTFATVVDNATGTLAESIIRLIFALAFVYFLWGVVQYVLYPNDEAKKDKGRQFIIWGLIALTVMFSVYGLIRVLMNTLLL